MNTDIHLQRAQLLIDQNRHEQAADQIRRVLAQDPNNSFAHALLSLCLNENHDTWQLATEEAETAIHLAPDTPFPHYAHARVLFNRGHKPEALEAIQQALALDVTEAGFHALEASCHVNLEDWKRALECANRGLEYDPENEGCSAMRAFALERLGLVSDATHEAELAVRRNPDSGDAHAMRGWALLRSGKYKESQVAFREALRLEPTNEFARSGMIEALNSNHFIFRQVHRFYSFMGRLSGGTRWAVIIGLYIGNRALGALGDTYPAVKPYTLPLGMLYIAFCVMTWVADPLFNTFLRFHRFGRFLLSNRQRWESNAIASCLALGVAFCCIQLIRQDYPGAIIALITPVFMALPISVTFRVETGWPLYTAIAATTGMGALCLTTVLLVAVDGEWVGPYLLYMISIFVFSFAGNALMNVSVRR